MTPNRILALLFLVPAVSFAGPAQVAQEPASGMIPQVIPQVVPPDPLPAPGMEAKGASPIIGDAPQVDPAANGQAGVGTTAPQSQEQNPLQNILTQMLSGMTTGGQTPPPENTDWANYSYPDNYKFGYGGQGAGNIGNGLCTAKNKDRTQVRQGYCEILGELLTTEGTCANTQMKKILEVDGSDGSGIGQLNEFCPTYGKLTDDTQRTLVFEQILATLITQESGWNPNAQEKPWIRYDGARMGGKGLFQIGVNDSAKGGDCAGINSTTIFDPKTNMKCGACIALSGLASDRTIGHGTTDANARGMAQYFGPMREKQAAKRKSMSNAVAEYCRASTGDGGNKSDFEAISVRPGSVPSAK
jgi:hypothetical protein